MLSWYLPTNRYNTNLSFVSPHGQKLRSIQLFSLLSIFNFKAICYYYKDKKYITFVVTAKNIM